MSKKQDKRLIAGMDIGTSKIVTLVGEVTPEGEVEIIGLGSHPSRGLKKGVVVNIESTVASMQRAVEEAELMPAARFIPSTPALPAVMSAASTRTASSPSVIGK